MAKWINRTLVQAPRNGTTSHAVAFTAATAGNLLVAVVEGAVTSTTPSGWTLPANGAAVSNTGLYVWWKVATAGEAAFTTTHNGSNYPIAVVVYEFHAGSTFVKAAQGSGIAKASANPALTGLTGTNLGMAAIAIVGATSSATWTTVWTGATEDVDVAVATSGTDGYLFSAAYVEDSTATSFQPTGAATTTTTDTKEALTFAVKVSAATGTPASGSGSGSWTFAGAGTGKRAPKASGAGSWAFAGAGAGKTQRRGTGLGGWAFAGTGTGKRTPRASGSGSWAFAGSGSGRTSRSGTGSGLLGWVGAGTGTAPVIAEYPPTTVPGTATLADNGGTALLAGDGTGAATLAASTPGVAVLTVNPPGLAALNGNGQSTAALVGDGTSSAALQNNSGAVTLQTTT